MMERRSGQSKRSVGPIWLIELFQDEVTRLGRSNRVRARGKQWAHEHAAREKPFDGSIGGIEAVAETTAALTSSLRRPTRTSAPGDQGFDLGDRKSAVLPAVLAVTVLAAPVAAYFWFIDRFSVNVVSVDQWSNIKLIQSWHKNGLSFGDLWAPHFDHRVLFPNFIVLGLAQFTHFNVIIEEYISAVMLVATTALVIATHRRRSRSTPLIWYLPVALLLFSFVQYQNTLWGFQMAWYLVTLGLATALYFLDRPILTQAAFLAAIAATVVASYSSLQGLIVWPVGLVLLYFRRRSRQQLVTWCTVAVVTTALYFYHWQTGAHSKPTFVFTHLITSLKFFLFLIGSVLGVQGTIHAGAEIAFGSVVVAVSIGLIVRYWRRDEQTTRPFGVALVLYGLLFGATITQARAWYVVYGFYAPSRYSTCGLLALVGCYLVLLDRSGVELRHAHSMMEAAGAAVVADDARWRREWHIGRATAWIVVAAGIALEVIYGTGHGFASAKTWSQDQMQAADITVNYQKASPYLLESKVYFGYPDGESRALLKFMAAQRLSVFGTTDRSYYAGIGLLPALTATQTTLGVPTKGAILSGVRVLDAGASDASGVRSVRFLATNSRDHRSLIGIGTRTKFGWLTFWNTRTVSNGSYDLLSVATGYGGRVAQSAEVRITVRN